MTDAARNWLNHLLENADLEAQRETRLTEIAKHERDAEMRAFTAALFADND